MEVGRMRILRRCLEWLPIWRFLSDRGGNIAVFFGIAIVPMTVAVGVAFDYTIAATDRTKLQHANDEAIIAVARALQANPSLTVAQQTAIVTAYLASQVPELGATIAHYAVGANGQITLDTTAKVARLLTRIISDPTGQYAIIIGAHSAAMATAPSLEVALVLDHTGSMGESAGGMTKIAALQQAANNLVTTIMANSTTKVAIVPFSMSVNVGSSYNTAPWVDTLGLSSIHWKPATGKGGAISKPALYASRFDLFNQVGVSWRGCFEVRPGSYATSEAPPTLATPDTLFVPIFAPDEPGAASAGQMTDSSWNTYGVTNSYLNDGFGPASHESATWATILADPSRYTNSASKAQTGSGTAPNDQGPNYACDPIPMLRLTSSQSTVQSKINALTPAGNTNILEGLMWGWRALSPNAPFSDGKSYTWNVSNPTQPNRKIIVLMTDGYNTWDPQNNPSSSQYSAFGYYGDNRISTSVTDGTSARNAMDAGVATACGNIKGVTDGSNNAAITIYTIGFSIPSDPIDAQGLQLLQNCASNDSSGNPLFFQASDSSGLISAFGAIAKSINNLRLTQ
jgi:Flp pilus assembly protein TadG